MDLRTAQKIVTLPFQQKILSVKSEAAYAPTNSAVQATPAFDKKDALLVSLPLFTLTEGKTRILVKNPHNHSYKVEGCLTVANFSQGEDSASNSKHKINATSTGAPHQMSFRVLSHPELVVPRTDRNRQKTMVPNSGDMR